MCLAALLALFTSLACQAGQVSKQPRPLPSPSSTPAYSDTLFSFERATDVVSRALVAAFRSYLASPIDQGELDDNAATLAAARATLAANGDAATQILLRELTHLTTGPDQERERNLICWLLADAATPSALAKLGELALVPPPPEGPEGTPVVEHTVALSQLQRVASGGNRTAREQILNVVARAENKTVRRSAIAAYYAVSPSRFRARREVTARLPVSERYLAHQTF
jgi:hypothetical protein